MVNSLQGARHSSSIKSKSAADPSPLAIKSSLLPNDSAQVSHVTLQSLESI
ncbi:MAG: hypothetical protein KFKLKKLM_02058 [Flavobacteriales bacterium]|nr:hypothetical protein [Flavobacteriales bacterium]